MEAFSTFPDLILIDGGKGHVNSVIDVMNALKIYVPVAGMVKDDFHQTEDLIFEGVNRNLKSMNNAYRLVCEIQEEVHRFAIEYHKSIRSKEMIQSVLNEIEGIGEKKRVALLKHFRSIEAIKIATYDALLEVPGINKTNAKNIVHFFEKNIEYSDNSEG